MPIRAHQRARRAMPALGLLVGLLAAGCGLPALTPSRPAPAPAAATAAPTPSSAPDTGASRRPSDTGQISTGQIDADLGSAEQVVDGFWARHWSDFFTGTYRSPKIFGLYDASNAPSCGNASGADPDNAFYCPAGDFLAFGAPLLAKGYALGTNSFTYLVVAHEWGHAVQNRLSDALNSRAAELQADCFAGATIYGAAADGSLRFEPGDEKAIATSLTQLADNTAWTSTSDHGDAFQRVEAFDTGRKGGVQACLPMQ
jgi:uncharacterized protein